MLGQGWPEDGPGVGRAGRKVKGITASQILIQPQFGVRRNEDTAGGFFVSGEGAQMLGWSCGWGVSGVRESKRLFGAPLVSLHFFRQEKSSEAEITVKKKRKTSHTKAQRDAVVLCCPAWQHQSGSLFFMRGSSRRDRQRINRAALLANGCTFIDSIVKLATRAPSPLLPFTSTATVTFTHDS